jgi:Family of unknown function (DUF5681)
MTFQSGQSGNPAGRPKGARGKATILAEGMFDGEAQEVIRAAIDLAKSGDVSVIRVCLDRIAPRKRDRPVDFELPPLRTAADATVALGAITAAVSAGDLTPQRPPTCSSWSTASPARSRRRCSRSAWRGSSGWSASRQPTAGRARRGANALPITRTIPGPRHESHLGAPDLPRRAAFQRPAPNPFHLAGAGRGRGAHRSTQARDDQERAGEPARPLHHGGMARVERGQELISWPSGDRP